MVNSVDPDQTAPIGYIGAVCSGSTLFASILNSSVCLFCLFDLILYIPSTISHLNRDGSSWVEPVLS